MGIVVSVSVLSVCVGPCYWRCTENTYNLEMALLDVCQTSASNLRV
jgi:hypothetical protein